MTIRRSTVTALAVVVGVLVAAAGLFVALFLMERADIADLDGQSAETGRSIDREADRLSASQSTVDDLDAERVELESTIGDLRLCADAANAALTAAQAQDGPGVDKAVDDMFANCGR